MDSLDNIYKRQILNEEYKIWKKNAPFMYDLVITHMLEWASLSVEWLPIIEVAEDPDLRIHKLILGTDSPEGDKNYMMIAKVKIPKENIMVNIDSYTYSHEMKPGYNAIGQSNGNIEIEKRILHEGPVINSKYMPQDPNIIGTKTNNGEIHLFNINLSYTGDKPSPELRLLGHGKKGLGLDWNPKKKGQLLSGSNDGKICIWNTDSESSASESTLHPTEIFETNKSPINEVCWNKQDEHLFGSVAQDGIINLWDIRQKQPTYTSIRSQPLNSISFCPQTTNTSQEYRNMRGNNSISTSQYLYLTAGVNSTPCLWDMRQPEKTLQTFSSHHTAQINKVEFNPKNPCLFAACSDDSTVSIWDISRIGETISQEELQDGPPELLFIHGGHRRSVGDFSWGLMDGLGIASVEKGLGSLCIWKAADYILNWNQTN